MDQIFSENNISRVKHIMSTMPIQYRQLSKDFVIYNCIKLCQGNGTNKLKYRPIMHMNFNKDLLNEIGEYAKYPADFITGEGLYLEVYSSTVSKKLNKRATKLFSVNLYGSVIILNRDIDIKESQLVDIKKCVSL
jgi:hypothetical protein